MANNTPMAATADVRTLMINKMTTASQLNHTVPRRIPNNCMVLAKKPGDFIPWNNPDNLISRDLERAVDKAVAEAFLPVLFLISFPSNVINMAVFWKQGLKERINLCLFSLSFADCLYMVYSVLFYFDRIYLQLNEGLKFGPIFEFIINSYLMVLRGVNWVSGFISTLIACERCFCVVNPLRSQTVLKTRTMATVLVTGTVIIMSGCFMSTMRWSFACVYDPETNSTSKILYTSKAFRDRLKNMPQFDKFIGITFATVQPISYVIIVSVTTIVTAAKLRQMSAWREQTSSASMSSREIALTRMLIGVSVLFVICSIPLLTLGVSTMSVADINLHGRYYNLFNLMVRVFELFSYINASFNFFIYCFLGSKFRDTLQQIFPCGVVGKILSLNSGRKGVVSEQSRSATSVKDI